MILTKRTFRTTDTKGCEMHVTVYVSREYRHFDSANDERLYVCRETGAKARTLDELKRQVTKGGDR